MENERSFHLKEKRIGPSKLMEHQENWVGSHDRIWCVSEMAWRLEWQDLRAYGI